MNCLMLTAALRGIKKRFRSKTLLEQFLIIFSTVLFIVFVSLVLALIYNGRAEKSCDKGACTTEACLKQAGNMLEKMNSSIDPCEDFYEYACGSYHKHSSLSHGKRTHTVEDDVEDEIHRIIRDLFLKSNKTGKSSSFEKADSFYSSCMNDVDEFESIDQRIQLLLSESGIKWPKSTQSDETSRKNIQKTIVYGSHPFFDIFVQLEGAQYVFQLKKPKTGTKLTILDESIYEQCCLNHNMLSARYYESLLVSTFLLLVEKEIHSDMDKDSTKQKSVMATDLIQVERDLAKNISKLPCKDFGNATEERHSVGWEFDVLTALGVTEFSSTVYETDCKEYVDAVELKLKTYIYQFYLVWRFVAKFLPLLSTPFRHSYIRLIHEGMNAGLAGDNRMKYFNERWKQCVHLTNYIYGLAIADAYIKDGYYKEDEKEVTSLVDSIKEHYLEIFSSHSSLDNDTFSILAAMLDDITIDLNYPDDNLDNEKLDNYYEELNKGTSFLKTYLKKEKFETKRRLGLDTESPKVNRSSFTDIPPLSKVINMDIETNTLIFGFIILMQFIALPLGLFRFPYYIPEFYKFAKYGGIAALVAREMYHGFNSVSGMPSEESDSESSFDAIHTSEKECYKKQYRDSETEEHQVKNTDRWEEVIFDNIALKIAYALYRKDMEEEEDKPHLPGIDLNSDKLFFLHYAQTHCEIRNETRSAFDSDISAKFRVNNVMMNKKEFSETFECKEDTPMNPKNKCKIWD